MSYISYISLPKRPKTHPSTSDKSIGIMNSGIGFWDDMNSVIFTECFKNPFVFGFDLEEMPGSYEQIHKIHFGKLEREAKEIEIKKIHEEEEIWQRQKLYEFLHHVLIIGEFAEIFTCWDSDDFNFGPPSTECKIDLEDLLNYETVKCLGYAMCPPGNTEDGHKLTVYRTV